jgi:hypothetical protein
MLKERDSQFLEKGQHGCKIFQIVKIIILKLCTFKYKCKATGPHEFQYLFEQTLMEDNPFSRTRVMREQIKNAKPSPKISDG